MDYIAAGNVMLDTVRFVDGKKSKKEHIGGPATFAYSGIRIWTDSVIQCSNLGADYSKVFNSWIKENDVIEDGFKVVCDYCNHSYLVYKEDGTYGSDEGITRFRSDWIQDFGYMKTKPEEIEKITKNGNTKGLYLAQNVDHVFWDKLAKIKKRDGFKIMWEIEAPSSYKKYMDSVLRALKVADIFSINIAEAENLFDVKGEKECIKALQNLPIEVSIFRVGDKGLYSVTKDAVYYLPPANFGEVVDPTGCGNTSTGSALYAFCEGYDPLMIGIMANIASAQNILQYGVIPDFSSIREKCFKMADYLYKQYKEKENMIL